MSTETPPYAMTTEPRASSAHALVPRNITEAVDLAKIMAEAQLAPEHLRNKPGDCLLIVMQAQRWGMDVVSVAQCTSVVHGKLCYEGKLVAAALYAMGAVDGRLHYDIQGAGQAASITVTGTPKGGVASQSVRGCVKDWRTFGKDKQGNRIDNAWDKMPEDMLVYRGTRQWARRYAPEALLGVYTPDEMEPEVNEARVLSTQPNVPPTYPDDAFAGNLPAWARVILAGKRTVDEIIALAQTRGALTSEQIAAIRACPVAVAATEGEGA